MSSIHIFRTETGFACLSDGSLYDPQTGIFAGPAEKVWSGDRFAVGMLGHPADVNAPRVAALSSFPTFDDAEDFLVTECAARREAPAEGIVWLCIPLFGWSDRRGAWTLVIANIGDQDPSFEPWSVTEIDAMEFSRGPVVPEEEMRSIFSGVTRFDETSIRQIGADYFEAQRRHKIQTPGYAEIYGVGGFVDLTIVDAKGARQERLREWPDVVGEVIDPWRGAVAEVA